MNGPGTRPVQQNVNFYEQVNELHKLAHLLWGGYSAHLEMYEDWQNEYQTSTWRTWTRPATESVCRCYGVGFLCRLRSSEKKSEMICGLSVRVSSQPPKR